MAHSPSKKSPRQDDEHMKALFAAGNREELVSWLAKVPLIPENASSSWRRNARPRVDLGLLAKLNREHKLLSFGERNQIYHRLIKGLGCRPVEKSETFSFEPVLALLLSTYNQSPDKSYQERAGLVPHYIWSDFIKDIHQDNPRLVSQKEWFGIMKAFQSARGENFGIFGDGIGAYVSSMAKDFITDQDGFSVTPLKRKNFLFALRASFVLEENARLQGKLVASIVGCFPILKPETSRPFLRKLLSLKECSLESVSSIKDLSKNRSNFLLQEYARIKELPMRFASRRIGIKKARMKL